MKATADDLNLFEQLFEIRNAGNIVRIQLDDNSNAMRKTGVRIIAGDYSLTVEAQGKTFAECALTAITKWGVK